MEQTGYGGDSSAPAPVEEVVVVDGSESEAAVATADGGVRKRPPAVQLLGLRRGVREEPRLHDGQLCPRLRQGAPSSSPCQPSHLILLFLSHTSSSILSLASFWSVSLPSLLIFLARYSCAACECHSLSIIENLYICQPGGSTSLSLHGTDVTLRTQVLEDMKNKTN